MKARVGQLAATIVAATSLVGCAIISSKSITDQEAAKGGVAYMLPKAYLPVTVSEQNGAFSLSVGTPKYAGDPTQVYVASYLAGRTADDEFTIEVDPATGLLTSINAKADDKLAEIVTKLAKGAAAFAAPGLESGQAGAAVILYQEIDPSQSLDHLNAMLRNAVMDYAGKKFVTEGCRNLKAEDVAKLPICNSYADMSVGYHYVQLQIDPPAQPSSKIIKPDCTIGVCYRIPQPFAIHAYVIRNENAVGSSSAVALLPNNSPAISVDISRTVFVTQNNTLSFQNGMLKKREVTKASELNAAASLPLDILKVITAGTAEAFGLRETVIDAEKSLTDSATELAGAQKNLADARKSLNESGLESGSIRPAASILTTQFGLIAPPGRDSAIGGRKLPGRADKGSNPTPRSRPLAPPPTDGSSRIAPPPPNTLPPSR